MTRPMKSFAAAIPLVLLVLLVLLAAPFAPAQPAASCCNSPGLTPSGPKAQTPEFKDLPKAGKKCRIGDVY
jgi:hypothetical protein